MEKLMNSDSPAPKQRARNGDRRNGSRVGPPPYYTREGKVLVDRRSHCDRRGTWIREFSLDADHESGSDA